MKALVIVGVAGVLLDILLHVLQMFPKLAPASVRVAAWITLVSCILGGLSLIPQWNLPLLVMEVLVGALAILSLVTGIDPEHAEHGKEVGHEGT